MALEVLGCEPQEGELYLSGAVAPPGLYGLVGTEIRILLQAEGRLPPAPDGRTACYEFLSIAATPPENGKRSAQEVRL